MSKFIHFVSAAVLFNGDIPVSILKKGQSSENYSFFLVVYTLTLWMIN